MDIDMALVHSALWTVRAFFLQPKCSSVRSASSAFCSIVVVDCYYDELDYDCVLINNFRGVQRHELSDSVRTQTWATFLEPRHPLLRNADGYYSARATLLASICYLVYDLRTRLRHAASQIAPIADAYFCR